MTDEETPIFERGAVVYRRSRPSASGLDPEAVHGADPVKGEEAARPWLILSNHEGRPFHGEQYFALTLTTTSWMDELIEIPATSWIRGETPAERRIVPWGVQSIDQADIAFWHGRIERTLVDDAVNELVEERR